MVIIKTHTAAGGEGLDGRHVATCSKCPCTVVVKKWLPKRRKSFSEQELIEFGNHELRVAKLPRLGAVHSRPKTTLNSPRKLMLRAAVGQALGCARLS